MLQEKLNLNNTEIENCVMATVSYCPHSDNICLLESDSTCK